MENLGLGSEAQGFEAKILQLLDPRLLREVMPPEKRDDVDFEMSQPLEPRGDRSTHERCITGCDTQVGDRSDLFGTQIIQEHVHAW